MRATRRRWLSRALAAALTPMLVATPAFAWGDLGHRVTAAIASPRLAPSTRAEVDRLVAASYVLATPLCPVTSLADATVWADCVRSQYKPRFGRSSPWHYIDVEVCGSFNVPPACPDGQCVVAQLDRWRKVLADPGQPLSRRVEALMWVAHLTGDIQQPLHVGENGDRGGNQVQATIDGRQGKAINLHSIWDRDLVEKLIAREGGVEAFVAHSSAAAASVPPSSVDGWARESWDASRTVVYPRLPERPACGDNSPPIEHIGAAYEAAAEPVVRSRLISAGARLAAELNAALAASADGPGR